MSEDQTPGQNDGAEKARPTWNDGTAEVWMAKRWVVGGLATLMVALGVAIGLIPRSIPADTALFTYETVTCGSPWLPDYSKVTDLAVLRCQGTTEPAATLATVLMAVGFAFHMLLLVTMPRTVVDRSRTLKARQ